MNSVEKDKEKKILPQSELRLCSKSSCCITVCKLNWIQASLKIIKQLVLNNHLRGFWDKRIHFDKVLLVQ